MRKYELMFIVKSDMEEAEIKKTAEAGSGTAPAGRHDGL